MPLVARTTKQDNVRELQRTLCRAAWADPGRRFHAPYDKVYRRDVLLAALSLVLPHGPPQSTRQRCNPSATHVVYRLPADAEAALRRGSTFVDRVMRATSIVIFDEASWRHGEPDDPTRRSRDAPSSRCGPCGILRRSVAGGQGHSRRLRTGWGTPAWLDAHYGGSGHCPDGTCRSGARRPPVKLGRFALASAPRAVAPQASAPAPSGLEGRLVPEYRPPAARSTTCVTSHQDANRHARFFQ